VRGRAPAVALVHNRYHDVARGAVRDSGRRLHLRRDQVRQDLAEHLVHPDAPRRRGVAVLLSEIDAPVAAVSAFI